LGDARTGWERPRRRSYAPGIVQRRHAPQDEQPDHASAFMAMQRTAGNRAVSELVGRGSASAEPADARTVQRYTVVEPKKQKPGYWQGLGVPLRVADDGSMAVIHNTGAPSNTAAFQTFFATPAVIAASAQALAKAGSAFTIAPGPQTLIGSAPGSKKAAQQTLVKAVTANQDLARIDRAGYTFNACSANLHNFLGILRSMPGDPQKLERRRDVVLKLQGSLDHDRKAVVIGEDLSIAMLEARKIATGEDGTGASRQAYEGMKESMRKQVSKQYGIDEYAMPDVGEGFGINRGGAGGRDGMGHFAPVIAQSGDDRVTLENDVSQKAGQEKQKIGEINPMWYFRMFGPVKKKEDQTFWGEAKKYESADYGDRPLVTALGSAPRAQDEDEK
jgi:hypothetical protein